MTQELKIQKWGNSAGIRLPIEMLRRYKLQTGDSLAVEETPELLILRPTRTRPRYQLQELVNRCDPNAAGPTELEDWDSMAPVGREE